MSYTSTDAIEAVKDKLMEHMSPTGTDFAVKVTGQTEYLAMYRYLEAAGFKPVSDPNPPAAAVTYYIVIDNGTFEQADKTQKPVVHAEKVWEKGIGAVRPEDYWRGKINGNDAYIRNDGSLIVEDNYQQILVTPETIDAVAESSQRARNQ